MLAYFLVGLEIGLPIVGLLYWLLSRRSSAPSEAEPEEQPPDIRPWRPIELVMLLALMICFGITAWHGLRGR